ncbi:PHD finger protein 20-like, partial [Notothenia coriiceps]|uniref:PHD finger protein 20-like n=1 Tax=Notothenia coriiceps TaxID=8208 RepID=A0A6I9Q823_9TELE
MRHIYTMSALLLKSCNVRYTGHIISAALTLRAPSDPTVVTLSTFSHSFATSRNCFLSRSSPSHPDLQLWRLPWRREEGSRSASSPRGETSICYVSSEHCYQKPGASWEKSEERDKETQTVVVKQEQEEIKLEDVEMGPADATADAHSVTHTDTPPRIKAESHTHTAEPRPASEAECQLNLLEHVETLHHQISARMDLIERELD